MSFSRVRDGRLSPAPLTTDWEVPVRVILRVIKNQTSAGVRNGRCRLCQQLFVVAAILGLAPLRSFAAVTVTISPSSVNLPIGGSQQFTATVAGATDTSVTWTILEGTSGGTVSNSGLYAAPGAVGLYHVVATSNADNTRSAVATVALPGFVQTGLLHPDPCTATLLADGTVLYTGGGLPSDSFATSPAEIYNPATSTSTATGSITILRCGETATLLPNGQVLFAGGQTSVGTTATAEVYDPVAGIFSATGSMTAARQGHTATLLPDGTVLIAGGIGNCGGSPCALSTAELYIPSSGSFIPIASSLSAPYTGAAAILLSNGTVLIAGGGNNFAEIYNPATGNFSQSGAMINPRVSFAATLLENGTVLFAGGMVGSTISPTAEIYDPSAGTFTSTGNLNIPREFHVAALLSNGQVLIAGGNSTLSSPAAAELYDPVSGTFALTGSLSELRWSPAATTLSNGTVLIAGGNLTQRLSSIETYTPSTGVFTSQSVFLNVARTGHATTQLADGRLLLTGGEDEDSNVNRSAEIFDPSTGQFSLTGPLIQGRYGHTATLLANGNVLIVGGFSDKDGTQIAPTAEIYDTAAGTFSVSPANPNIPRADHTATLLGNGKVLIAGGQVGSQQATSSVELYDPVAGTFTLAGNMDAPRYNHTATLLNNGQVLIAEGITMAGTPGNGVGPDDLYDPNSGTFTEVGPHEIWHQGATPNPPFDSVLLTNGQVLVDNDTIFDPPSNTLSPIQSSVNFVDANLQDYKFASLPNDQVFATSNFYPTYLYDPGSETFTASAPLQYFRSSPTVKLLPNGEVLVAGGAGVAQVEFFVPPVAASNAGPVLTSLSPSSAAAGGPGFTLLVAGANFVQNSVVNFNGVPQSTTFLNAEQLTIAVSATQIATVGTASISASNPGGGSSAGGASNPLTLAILPANVQPIVGTLIPASTTAGGSAVPLIVTGSNFTANSTISFNGGSQVIATYLGAGELQTTIPANYIAVAGTVLVAISNPGSSDPSALATFTVNNPVPTEGQLTPSTVAAGSAALTLTVTGTNFNSSSTILVNGAPLTTALLSSTQVQATLPATDLAQGGSLNIGVSNPAPGGGTASTQQFVVTLGDYSLTAATASVSVTAGQTAMFTLTVAPLNNGTFNSAITLTPSGMPAGTTASFSPSNTVTPAGTPQTVALFITTTAASAVTLDLLQGKWRVIAPICLIGMALVTLWLATGICRRRPRRLAPQLLLVLLLAPALGLVGCAVVGGGEPGVSSAPQQTPATGTPSGTYPITVTANSGGESHSATVTLNVM